MKHIKDSSMPPTLSVLLKQLQATRSHYKRKVKPSWQTGSRRGKSYLRSEEIMSQMFSSVTTSYFWKFMLVGYWTVSCLISSQVCYCRKAKTGVEKIRQTQPNSQQPSEHLLLVILKSTKIIINTNQNRLLLMRFLVNLVLPIIPPFRWPILICIKKPPTEV